MTKVIKFKRLCVDTNVIMGLALLYERGEKEFIDTNLASGSSLTASGSGIPVCSGLSFALQPAKQKITIQANTKNTIVFIQSLRSYIE